MPLALQGALASARARGWPLVMGIVNVTPDSFSDGGQFLNSERAFEHALALEEAGADLIDIGGESTRPGAGAVNDEQELERVVPVIEAVRARSAIAISIDSSKPGVMAQAVDAGADLINDVRALRSPGALQAAADCGVPVVLMHMLGEPRTMQKNPRYDDVVTEVRDFLLDRVRSCEEAGIAREHVCIDPGIGFGKTLAHNLALLKHLRVLCETGLPVLVGASRKSMLERITGRDAGKRIAASVSVALHAAHAGAAILRVHDVAETVDALKVDARIAQAEGIVR